MTLLFKSIKEIRK